MDSELRDHLREKQRVIRSVLNTPEGKNLFELLEDAFENRALKASDPHDTYYNLGQRDLVQYLRELRDYNE